MIKRDGKNNVFWNPNIFGSGNGSGKILHLSDLAAIKKVINERGNIADRNLQDPVQHDLNPSQGVNTVTDFVA